MKYTTRIDTQINFYKTVAIRGGLCETWVMISRGKSRLQAAEVWFLRSVIGVTRRDMITNDIRNERHVYRDNWKNCVKRKTEKRIP
jgi:hypothetical protein